MLDPEVVDLFSKRTTHNLQYQIHMDSGILAGIDHEKNAKYLLCSMIFPCTLYAHNF